MSEPLSPLSNMVWLTEAELKITAWVGKKRFANAEENNRDHGQGPSNRDRTPDNNIRGARCEFAASIVLNRFWRPTVGRIRDRDVGGMVEVRSTDRPRGRLIVKPADKDSVPFVLVIVTEAGSYHVRGWLFAGVVKDRFPLLHYPDTDPAHYAPQDALWPIGELREWMRYAEDGLPQPKRDWEEA